MVSRSGGESDCNERDTCDYSLARIHELAALRSITLIGHREPDGRPNNRVQRHLDRLQITTADVCRILQLLREKHFYKSREYLVGPREIPRWHDVYKISAQIGDEVHDLYIKLRLNRNVDVIELCSFHPEGWL